MFDMLKNMVGSVDTGFLYFMLILIAVAIVVVLIRKGLRAVMYPIKKEKVQIVQIERQDQNVNAAARKLSAGFPVSGSRFSTTQLQMSNMGHAMVDNLIYTFYLLDKDNRKIQLKIQANEGANMAQIGDLGYVTHQNGLILGFEKTGNINQ